MPRVGEGDGRVVDPLADAHLVRVRVRVRVRVGVRVRRRVRLVGVGVGVGVRVSQMLTQSPSTATLLKSISRSFSVTPATELACPSCRSRESTNCGWFTTAESASTWSGLS